MPARLQRLILATAVVGGLTACAATAPDTAPPPLPMPSQSAAITHGTPAPPKSASTLPGQVPFGTRPRVINHGPRTGGKIALTFDADMTDTMLKNLASGRVRSYANLKVLDILQQRDVPATFFLTGLWVERYPDVAARISVDNRFEVGNHTYRHSAYTPNCYTLPQLPRPSLTADARRAATVITALGGNQTRYFRFPGLCHDTPALTALAPLGVTVIDGDVVSGDPFATSAGPIIRAVLSQAKPGSIVILHITEGNAAYTDEALGPILKGLADKGLTPVRLSELLNAGR